MKRLITLAALCCSLAIVPVASGAILIFDLGIEFSGATPPAGPPPWLRATFNDFGGVGNVQLTMEAIGLTGDEFVSQWFFNFDPALNAAAYLPTTAPNLNVTVNTTAAGNNAFQADGDGLYDFLFDFAPPPGGAARFQAGESFVATFTGAGITANSFDFLSAPAGGAGPFRTAAHVQGIGPDGALSGWVGDGTEVPEPATMTLLGLGLVGSGIVRRRRRRRA